jgi:hypothetical protein
VRSECGDCGVGGCEGYFALHPFSVFFSYGNLVSERGCGDVGLVGELGKGGRSTLMSLGRMRDMGERSEADCCGDSQ